MGWETAFLLTPQASSNAHSTAVLSRLVSEVLCKKITTGKVRPETKVGK